MEKSKSSKCGDRLSELPDSLIVRVLSLLKTKDVLRTTILSKRWKDLWKTVPCLDFDGIYDCLTFQNVVNRTLVNWKGDKILKFGVKFRYKKSASSDLDMWLGFAIQNHVEVLNVNLLCFTDAGYSASQRLYSCPSIRELALSGCNLNIHGNVHWDRLKCLTIDCVFLSKHVTDKVLFGAPQLEVLILRIMKKYESLNIHSNSLKKLIVEKYSVDLKDDETVTTVLKIWAPKIEALQLSKVLYDKWELLNGSYLITATVVFAYPLHWHYVINDRFSGFELIEDVLGHIYHSKRRVEQVTFPYLCIDEVLRKMMKKDMVAPLSYAKFLKLHVTDNDGILDVLEIFPKLTILVLEGSEPSSFGNDTFEIRCDTKESFGAEKCEADFPKSCFLHLKKVEIDWTLEINSIFPIIEFLLKYGSKLEKLVLRVDFNMELETELFTAKKLLTLPRSSPNAEVVFG